MKRPSKKLLLQLYGKDRLTDAQVAARFNVSPSTPWRWRRHYGIELLTGVYTVAVLKGGTPGPNS